VLKDKPGKEQDTMTVRDYYIREDGRRKDVLKDVIIVHNIYDFPFFWLAAFADLVPPS